VVGNHPEDVAAVTAAVKKGAEISAAQVAELRRGDWGTLKNAGQVSAPAGA
jgi:nitrite reductase (NADH) large subunit